MPLSSGDEYVRQVAAFIRQNDQRLASATFARPRQRNNGSLFSWATSVSPMVLETDSHHLFYLLMRLEGLALDVGELDVVVDGPSRPLSCLPHQNVAETASLASFRSSVSRLSLGTPWWSRPTPPSVDDELKFIYSTFTKIPALSLRSPGPNLISDLASDPPNQNALPLDAFRNLQVLECDNIDPRILLGWDRLAESLRSLKIRQSGLQDLSDIFIQAVLIDQQRRMDPAPSRQRAFHASDPLSIPVPSNSEDVPPARAPLSTHKWAFLRHLYLPHNDLTFFPSQVISLLSSITHLDLSSNLFVSVPPGLNAFAKLQSLNLSDNLIDSLLGIYLHIGPITYLNLSHNRLESLCGLERLHALERVDVRFNLLDESAEVGRLSELPRIGNVWVEGNPFVDIEEGYRVSIFNYFRTAGREILLDGSAPGFYEARSLVELSAPSTDTSATTPPSTQSPPVVAVGHHRVPATQPKDTSTPTSGSASPNPTVSVPGTRTRKRKATRIVQLEGELASTDALPLPDAASVLDIPARSRHTRYHTDNVGDDSRPGRQKLRQARVSASFIETQEYPDAGESMEDYRKRIEGLQKDMGDGWLKVYSQTQLQTTS